MSSLKVLHCAETIKGGIATYLRELLQLQRASFGSGSVAVVVPGSQVGELPVPEGVVLIGYSDNGGRISNALALARAVLSICTERQPGVVHIHSTFAGATVRPTLALFAPRAKVIYCPHGWAWDRPMSQVARYCTQLIERVLSYLSTTVVCISEHERRGAIEAGIPTKKLTVVLNGVATQAPSPQEVCVRWPDSDIRLLFVGRFDHQKGVDLLCNALEQLGTKVSAVLAGGSVLADEGTFSLPSNAVSVGWIAPAQLETLLSQADVLVMPSRWEGFGLTATEAMRAALPVIATRVGGLPEIVLDGTTGVLIESESAEAICRAVLSLDKNLLSAMGDAGRKRFHDKFTMDRVHAELCCVYGLGSVAAI